MNTNIPYYLCFAGQNMWCIVVVFFITALESGKCVAPSKPVTNEDIRDAILSVVHMLRSTEDKLERHEYRERALGDQIKKALTTIDKRQKLLDPVKGTLSRLDERLAAVETILMQKDERERIQLEKTNELVEQLQQNLPKLFEKLRSDLSSVPTDDYSKQTPDRTLSKTDLDDLKKQIESKLDNITNNVAKNVEKIREDNKNSTQLLQYAAKNLEDVKIHINSSQKDKNDTQSNILQELQKQKANVEQILTNVKTIVTKLPNVAETSDVQAAKNETLKFLEQNSAKLQKSLESIDAAKSKSDSPPKILQAIEAQKVNVDQILSNVKTLANKVPETIIQPSDVRAAQNETLNSLEQVKQDLSLHISQINRKIEEGQKITDKTNEKLQKTIDSIDAATSKNDLHPKILQAVEQQKSSIDQILSNIKTISSKIPDKIAQVSDIQATLKPIEQLKKDFAQQVDVRKSTEQNNAKLQKAVEGVDVKTAKVLQAIEQQKTNADQILSNIKTIIKKVPDKVAEVSDVQTVKSETLKLLEQIKKDLAQQTSILDKKISDSHKSSDDNNKKLQKTIDSIDSKTKPDLQTNILQALEQQKSNVDELLSRVRKVPNRIADITDVQDARVETTKLLDQIRNEIVSRTSDLKEMLADLHARTDENSAAIYKTVADKNVIQPALLQALEFQKEQANQILSSIQTISTNVPNTVATKADVQNLLNQSSNLFEQSIRDADLKISQLLDRVNAVEKITEKGNEKLHEAIVKSTANRTGNDLQPYILQALELQNGRTNEMLSSIQTISNKVPSIIVTRTDVFDLLNQASKLFEQSKLDINARVSELLDKVNAVEKLTEQSNEKLQDEIMKSNKTRNDLQPQILQAVELQKADFAQISRDMQMMVNQISKIAQVQDVDNASNETLKTLSGISNQCNTINKQLEDIQSAAEQNQETLHRAVESVSQRAPDLQPTILHAIETHNNNIEQLLSNIKTVPTTLSETETNKNETLQSLQQIKNEIASLQALSEKNNENLQKTIIESGEMAGQLNANVASSFEKLTNTVRSLNKLDQIMIQTADAALDTKRRVEYGVHQILLDVTAVVKKHSKDLNSTLNARFDNLESSLLQPENGALSNLTSRIANEIDQVWRQIGVLHQQMGANTETLEKIQTQTDSYANGSANTMDNMKGKVTQITNSMAKVDENLNYLLGRLSLITQEFNSIKTGLGEALDRIKGNSNVAQQKTRETGPGPHPIESHEMQDATQTAPRPSNYQL